MSDRAPPRQLPLDLGHAPAASRDDLVMSAANAQAISLLDRWPDWQSGTTVLAGPPGSGKSHIAAVWRQVADAHEADARRITPADINAIASRPVLVDAIEAGHLDETGLFHLINAGRQWGSHLLLVSSRFPAAWGVTLPDLASRLKTASVVEIGEPDDELLASVITKLFADRQIEVEAHVVRFLVRRMERSLSAATRVVDALDRKALESQSRITRAMAAAVVETQEMDPASMADVDRDVP